MGIKKIVITGESWSLARHQVLFTEMSKYVDVLLVSRKKEWYEKKIFKLLLLGFFTIRTGSFSKAYSLFEKRPKIFIMKSQRIEHQIKQLEYNPELVVHLFSTCRPFWHKPSIPYVMYLDYTMALAEKNWLLWAYFIDHKERDSWLKYERESYEQAYHLFTMSNIVKSSLIKDYGIDSQKITVVGSSGNFIEAYDGEKTFGNQQILFNGSDFHRKGGDLVIAAFKYVKKSLPEAKLVIIGKKIFINEDGIDNPGYISSRSELHNLFLKTDLVVAPGYCDPFPTFLMEAMNYGIPCIVSASDGMPEIVAHQVNGIVIEQPTEEILANQIVNLLSNPSLLRSMSQAARNHVKNKFNWNNIAKQIVEVLLT